MIKHYQSSKYNREFSRLIARTKEKSDYKLSYNIHSHFQTIIGFGGAFTEAAAYTFYEMPAAKQLQVLNAYFHPQDGLNYNLGRVSIHSCDFSLGNYTYVEEGDESLDSFDIKRDLKYVVPMIKAAEAIKNDKISILASPWSPPAWMKSNGDMNHGGYLLEQYKDAWSRYYIKFLEAYKNQGIHVFALTVQNEPAAKQVWDSCLYTKEEEKDFVRDFLGPQLKNSKFKDVKLLIWDHNRDMIVERAETAYNDPKASQYIWGTAYHWYVSEAFENLSTVHEMYPDKHLLFTEGTIEGGVKLNQFESGERYARNMIGDFNHFSEGYIEWNLMLNEQGGPNHVGNYCDAPIIYDRKNDILHFNSSYYIIGHFSKFIQPGARRIESNLEHKKIQHVAFVNPNGDVVIIIQNETEEETVIQIDQENFNIEARSVSTIFIKGEADDKLQI